MDSTNSVIRTAATAYMAPKILRKFRWQWLLYGVAAYYALKLMRNRGILPKQTGAAVDFLDHEIDVIKEKIGFQKTNSESTETLH